jgi:glycosyl transferase family 25
MKAFVINLDSSSDRWGFIKESFASTGLQLHRISAVNGRELSLPIKGYSESRFRMFHGRLTNKGAIGCYLSHIKALKAFLDSHDDYGLVLEDDVRPTADFMAALESSLSYSRTWDILRLSALSDGIPLPVCNLINNYRLCVSMGRLKGSGAYVVSRQAASAFVNHLLPMWLPYDHAFDREWFYGLRSAYVLPFPCSQTDNLFPSSIQQADEMKLPTYRRWLTTYPYQAFNEVARWGSRVANFLRARHGASQRPHDPKT